MRLKQDGIVGRALLGPAGVLEGPEFVRGPSADACPALLSTASHR